MKDPMRESYHHIALGNATFIERVKEKMEHLGQRREIPSPAFSLNMMWLRLLPE